jgi:hypothetical protein
MSQEQQSGILSSVFRQAARVPVPLRSFLIAISISTFVFTYDGGVKGKTRQGEDLFSQDKPESVSAAEDQARRNERQQRGL